MAGPRTVKVVEHDWVEAGNRVYVRHHRSWDLNVGLVIGRDACVVIDTRSSRSEGRELATAVRRVTPLPWIVINTHAHIDHTLGNVAFRPAAFWGHTRCAETLVARQEAAPYPDSTEGPAGTPIGGEIVAPDHTFTEGATLDLGDRRVSLRHPGRGHTDGDVVVEIPDTGVVFAGDLVRESGFPWFEDGFPLDWPATLAAVETTVTGPVVPGHGKVVDRGFVEEQRALLTHIAQTARHAYAEGRSIEAVAPELPLSPRTARDALDRAYQQLSGRI